MVLVHEFNAGEACNQNFKLFGEVHTVGAQSIQRVRLRLGGLGQMAPWAGWFENDKQRTALDIQRMNEVHQLVDLIRRDAFDGVG